MHARLSSFAKDKKKEVITQTHAIALIIRCAPLYTDEKKEVYGSNSAPSNAYLLTFAEHST